MNGAIYRFCRKCGKQVNVSALEKYDKNTSVPAVPDNRGIKPGKGW